MTEVVAHFIPSAPDVFQPTRFAQSHWGEDHLNGPALVGLAAHALESAFGLPEFLPARLTVDLFKAARGVPTTTKVALIRDGRRVRNSECELVQDGVTVARATLVQYRRSSAPAARMVLPGEFRAPADIDPDRLTYMGSDGAAGATPSPTTRTRRASGSSTGPSQWCRAR